VAAERRWLGPHCTAIAAQPSSADAVLRCAGVPAPQARQMLRQMLQQQLEDKRRALQELRQASSGVDQLLLQAALQLELAAGDSAQSAEQPMAMEVV
jgi:hypothetical protein